jgi:hypothetical protein
MNTLGSTLHDIYDGVVVGFPLGVLLGVLLWPARVAGVDFRQWFWDSTKPNELKDDSWIGLMRGAAHVLFGSAMLSLAIASIWLWLTCHRTMLRDSICSRIVSATCSASASASLRHRWSWNWRGRSASYGCPRFRLGFSLVALLGRGGLHACRRWAVGSSSAATGPGIGPTQTEKLMWCALRAPDWLRRSTRPRAKHFSRIGKS